MTLMGAFGFSETEVRAHSPAWMNMQLEAIARKRKLALADEAIVIAQAAAAGMGSYEDAASDLKQLIEELRAEDESTPWIFDPNAQTDMDAVRASGLLKN